MNFNFADRKMETTEELRAYAVKKVGKIDRLFRLESDASVSFSREHGRVTAEVTLYNNGMIYRASESTGDAFASVDASVASIERQIRKNKTRLSKKLRSGGGWEEAPADDAPIEAPAPESEEAEYDVIRSKYISMKPMTTEEAILQMNLLNHSFYAYRNSEEGDAFSVVYRRTNGGYGVLSDADED